MLEKGRGSYSWAECKKKATAVFNVFELLVRMEDGEGWAAD